MDNRWRILYCVLPELRGRMREAWAGKEKTGASALRRGKEKPPPWSAGVKRTEKE